jgi:hypothetical protein|tara:strand:- start:3892 stop:4176 length:285 start_codon:yes stop_codon:yes gene_type:complete
MLSWVKAYESFNNMTVSELKELLKAADLPVSGKKIDLISYLIIANYPYLFQTTLSDWTVNKAAFLHYKWLEAQKYIFYASINRQFLPLLMARLK